MAPLATELRLMAKEEEKTAKERDPSDFAENTDMPEDIDSPQEIDIMEGPDLAQELNKAQDADLPQNTAIPEDIASPGATDIAEDPDLAQELNKAQDADLPENTDIPEDIASPGATDIAEDPDLAQDIDLPDDAELFASAVQEEPSDKQIFAGDEDFYRSLENQAKSLNFETIGAPAKPRIRRGRFSNVQKILAAAMVVICAMLVYTFLKPLPRPVAGSHPGFADDKEISIQQADSSKSPHADPTQMVPKQIQKPESVYQSTQSVSLKAAQDFYRQAEYDKAYAAYSQLRQSLPADAEYHRDFFHLKITLCRIKSGRLEQADRLLDATAASSSPIVRLMTSYHSSLLDMQKNQYLSARTKAYQAIALIDAVDTDKDLASALRANCHFLVAQSMTRNVLALCDADADLPEKLWDNSSELDPFAGLNSEQLETLLTSGCDYLNDAMLAPQVRKIERQDGSLRFSLVCNRASIEELLARFAANAGLDIAWRLGNSGAAEQDTARKRPVTLYMSAATTQQLISAAAGQVGLLARLDPNNIVTVSHPDEYSALSEHTSLLSRETVQLWQKFLIAFHDDKRQANAHFALGLLHSLQNDTSDAIAEYKLTANRFSRSSLALYALLHSSKLKNTLRDYAGACQDLKQLVEQHPDSKISDRAYIFLADNTAKAGAMSEAARLYSKVYNLGLSSESQKAGALGAGKCFYQLKGYESAAKWLARYIDLQPNQKNQEIWSAYLLLGKTYSALGRPQQACHAFNYALAGQLAKEEYIETISALVCGYVDQKEFVLALDTLENVDTWHFSQAESTRVLLLKSRILREMGLLDKAVAVLGDKAEYNTDPQLKAEIFFELANCCIAKGQLELAHEKLAEIIVIVEPGPLAHKTALKLADVCLRLDRNLQAISVCSQLLDSTAPEEVKHQAEKILATAYRRQKSYDKAALALLDRPK